MPEDQVIALLTEIRDLQKQHIENYKVALQNQQKALEVQKNSVHRVRVLMLIIGAIVISLYLLPMFWLSASWGLRCFLRR